MIRCDRTHGTTSGVTDYGTNVAPEQIRDPADAESVVASTIRPQYTALFNEYQARLFAEGLLGGQHRFTRVTERIHCIDEVRLAREIHVSILLPGHLAETAAPSAIPTPLVIPLLAFRKDRLLDDRPVCDSDGRPVTVLNRAHTTDMHSYAVSVAVLDALADWIAEGKTRKEQAKRRRVRSELAYALGEIPKWPPAEASQWYDKVFVSNKGRKSGLRESARTVLSRSAVKNLCRRLVTHEYMLVLHGQPSAESPRTLDFRVWYESPYVVEQRRSSVSSWLRERLGFWPHAFVVHTPLAKQAQSYHIRMLGPPGHFVWEQTFVVPRSTNTRRDSVRADKGDFDPVPAPDSDTAVILGLPRRPSREGHLYAGQLDDDDKRDVSARFVFEERPPGVQGMAAVIAAVLGAVLLAYLLASSHLAAEKASVDAAALITLAPGLAAAAFLPSLTDPLVLQGPIGARLALMATVAISLAAAVALTTLDSSQLEAPGFEQGLWLAMIFVQFAMAGLLAFRVWRAYVRYGRVRVAYASAEGEAREGRAGQDTLESHRSAWLDGDYGKERKGRSLNE